MPQNIKQIATIGGGVKSTPPLGWEGCRKSLSLEGHIGLGTFTCGDPMWQVMLRSSGMVSYEKLYTPFIFLTCMYVIRTAVFSIYRIE